MGTRFLPGNLRSLLSHGSLKPMMMPISKSLCLLLFQNMIYLSNIENITPGAAAPTGGNCCSNYLKKQVYIYIYIERERERDTSICMMFNNKKGKATDTVFAFGVMETIL